VNLLKDYLSGMSGATIEGFSNGKACLKAFLQNYAKRIQTDVIIVDSDMPEMDGKTLIREIRDFERINKAKPSMIIMISGNDLTNIKELLDTSNKYKIQAFLKKPINKQDFLSSLVKTLTELNN
jgi:CheY-like chemotaxis protein